jgi:hypothetical protein
MPLSAALFATLLFIRAIPIQAVTPTAIFDAPQEQLRTLSALESCYLDVRSQPCSTSMVMASLTHFWAKIVVKCGFWIGVATFLVVVTHAAFVTRILASADASRASTRTTTASHAFLDTSERIADAAPRMQVLDRYVPRKVRATICKRRDKTGVYLCPGGTALAHARHQALKVGPTIAAAAVACDKRRFSTFRPN